MFVGWNVSIYCPRTRDFIQSVICFCHVLILLDDSKPIILFSVQSLVVNIDNIHGSLHAVDMAEKNLSTVDLSRRRGMPTSFVHGLLLSETLNNSGCSLLLALSRFYTMPYVRFETQETQQIGPAHVHGLYYGPTTDETSVIRAPLLVRTDNVLRRTETQEVIIVSSDESKQLNPVT